MSAPSPIDVVLDRVRAARKVGTAGWVAHCPAHRDDRPSLSISTGEAGKVLVLCRAGCTTEAVVEAMGMTMTDLFPAAGWSGAARNIAATYDYRAGDRRLLFQVVRFDPKGFAQRRPNGDGGWFWNLDGIDRVLYRLPELLSAPGEDVLVAEGEKDVDRLRELGFVATTNPGGAGKWRPEFGEALRGRRVFVLSDNDGPGRRHAEAVRRALTGIAAAAISIIELPGLPPKGDLSDWLDAGGTGDELRRLLLAPPHEATDQNDAPHDDDVSAGNPSARSHDSSQAALLVRRAAEVDLFRTPADEPFATIVVDAHRETHPVRSGAFKLWLRRQYWDIYRGPVAASALSDAVETLAARAMFGGETRPVAIRIAQHRERLYVDMANAAWEAVEISPGGWRVIANPPVRFRRPRTMAPLPRPVRGGSLALLRPFVNAANDESWHLLAGGLVAALRPEGPYLVLILHGEQGSAKTTTARVIRSLVDPSRSPLRAEPRDERDLLIAAKNNWTLAFDNVSHLPDWLSDALCRLSTGGGFGTRQLYTDEDEIVLDAQRPVILTAITEIATRGDLIDRSIMLEQPIIGERVRRSERDFWREFEAVRPTILGALFDAVAAALANEAGTTLERLPRMADPARWVTAAEPALGWTPGAFAVAYERNEREGHRLALDLSPIAAPLHVLASQGEWRGTAAHLRLRLGEIAGVEATRQRDWPKTPRALTEMLKHLAPNLRAAGIAWERPGRTGHARPHVIRGTTVITVTSVTQSAVPGDGRPSAIGLDLAGDGPTVTSAEPWRDGHDGDDGPVPPNSDADIAREMSRIFADDLDDLMGLA